MTQLSYEAAFDPLNAIFRIFRIRQALGSDESVPIDTLRILDFYLLFPFQIGEMKLKNDNVYFRKVSKEYDYLDGYGGHPSAPTLFARMKVIQIAALDTLALSGYLLSEELEKGVVKFTELKLTEEVYNLCNERNETQSSLMEMLKTFYLDYDLLGPGGLKDRTGLMEYRYDAA